MTLRSPPFFSNTAKWKFGGKWSFIYSQSPSKPYFVCTPSESPIFRKFNSKWHFGFRHFFNPATWKFDGKRSCDCRQSLSEPHSICMLSKSPIFKKIDGKWHVNSCQILPEQHLLCMFSNTPIFQNFDGKWHLSLRHFFRARWPECFTVNEGIIKVYQSRPS